MLWCDAPPKRGLNRLFYKCYSATHFSIGFVERFSRRLWCKKIYKMKNMNQLIQQLVQRSVAQRMAESLNN
jgi:hypothetical protein